MQDDQQMPAPPPRRWIKPVLFVSLALNLAVIGLVAGALLRHDGPPRASAGAPSFAAFGQPYMKALPREDRRAILSSLRDARGDALPDRAARRALFTDVLNALEAQPFDRSALEQAVARQAEISVTVQRRVQIAWLARVSTMSDAERLAYAARVKEVVARGPKRKGESGKSQ